MKLFLLIQTQFISTEFVWPAPGRRVLLARRQEEHHAGGHHDVPDRVCVVVVTVGLSEGVHAQPDERRYDAGDQEENPALPGGRITLTTLHATINL